MLQFADNGATWACKMEYQEPNGRVERGLANSNSGAGLWDYIAYNANVRNGSKADISDR